MYRQRDFLLELSVGIVDRVFVVLVGQHIKVFIRGTILLLMLQRCV